MFLSAPLACHRVTSGDRACRGSAAREKGSIVLRAGSGGSCTCRGGKQRHVRQRPRRERSGNPSRVSPQRCVRGVRNQRAPGAGGKGATTTPAAPPARPHLASLATEKRRRAGSSRQSVVYPPSPRPAFLSVAAATARGPALQNGGCSLFAATGPRRFHPPCRGPRPRVPPPPRPPR